MLTLTTAVLQLLAADPSIAPDILAMINAAITEVELMTKGATPTADQQAAIDAALDQAHAALQAS